MEPLRRGQPSVPFIAVAEAHVLRSLRTLGPRMSEIGEAVAAVRDAFDTPYGLVSKRIATDGADIFVEHGLGDLRRARDGQAPIHEVVCLRGTTRPHRAHLAVRSRTARARPGTVMHPRPSRGGRPRSSPA
ncbi:hypothetical protein ACPF8X_14830 [Streptomyces sp. G35A]